MQYWLTSDIFNWVTSEGTANVSRGREWFRPYEIWEHADMILKERCKDSYLVDAITNLKRAVNHRLRLLDKLYKFKKIPIQEKPTDLLNILNYLDIVRPMMLEKLIQIRNAVEHEDALPPDFEVCKIFSEFVWYFLRSTDGLVREIVLNFNLYPAGSEINLYSIECAIGIDNDWNIAIGGWVPSQLISDKYKEGWLSIIGEEFAHLSDYLGDHQDSDSRQLDQIENNDPKTRVTFFKGQIRGPAEALKKLLQLYFKVV